MVRSASRPLLGSEDNLRNLLSRLFQIPVQLTTQTSNRSQCVNRLVLPRGNLKIRCAVLLRLGRITFSIQAGRLGCLSAAGTLSLPGGSVSVRSQRLVALSR